MNTEVVRVEFHCHTDASPDSLTRVEQLLSACRRKGIDKVIITDHNSIQGAQIAQELDPQRVIIGEEIMTSAGELLAAFVTEEIPAGLAPMAAIERLRAQGAIIGVSHPFDGYRKGAWNLAQLQDIAPFVDAIEVFNARCVHSRFNELAQAFAIQHGLPGVAGSDAHTTYELGKALVLVPVFHDADSLRAALPAARFETTLSPWWVHLFSRYAARKKGRALT
jgi:hypothetical protein